MEKRMMKVPSKANSHLALRVIPGHFATTHSHINYYIDMTYLKARQSEAQAAARVLAGNYENTTYIDTIVCMDGCEIIGSYLADELTKNGIMSINAHKTMYIVSPEIHTGGQLIFRDNMQSMIANKHVLLLLASATTGITVKRALECIRYYGGIPEGAAALFSAVDSVEGFRVSTLFGPRDLPDYKSVHATECPLCKAGQKLDAIVNSYGYSKM
ncbi:MAG: orotate phosphoribosyltransferase [Lachnospiraceae bacterium]|nr:orotate phosphoribosyltransferase [Lachnospiraceae bacterium]